MTVDLALSCATPVPEQSFDFPTLRHRPCGLVRDTITTHLARAAKYGTRHGCGHLVQTAEQARSNSTTLHERTRAHGARSRIEAAAARCGWSRHIADISAQA